MPVYFFTLVIGKACVRGQKGFEYPSDDAARQHAINTMLGLLKGPRGKTINSADDRVEVTGEDGELRFKLSFAEVALKALPRSRISR
jgi:hypothetical protein